jgi:hypothetical protein
MKKVIIYLAMILCVLSIVSCTNDDYNENEFGVENNTTIENGEHSSTPPKKNG